NWSPRPTSKESSQVACHTRKGKTMAATALIVHDEPSLRKLLRIRLENDGIPVREVHNVHRATEEFASAADEIGVVISGVRMAGLGGPELLAAVRQVRSDVPVFFFTSH